MNDDCGGNTKGRYRHDRRTTPPHHSAPKNRPTVKQIEAFQGVATGFVVDALYGGGAFSMDIKPIGAGRDINCVAAGPALTANNGPADILATLASLNFALEGDIVVAAFDGFQGCAAAGDRVMGQMKNNGVAGFVTDGPMRDYPGLVEVGMPAWCTGLNPASPFAKGPGSVGTTIQIGGQQVETGDMIIADRDGVVVVPFAKIDEVLASLEHVKKLEAELDANVAAGQRTSGAIDQLLKSDQVRFVD